MNKTVLITGGTGFIGRALARKMLSCGYRVRVLTRKDPASLNLPDIEFVQGSYEDVDSLAKAISGCHAVFHLAALISGCETQDFVKANAVATANMVSGCIKASPQPEAFIYASSIAAGGPSQDKDNPRVESMGAAPVSDYGRTKLAGEKELLRLPPEVKTVVLRPPMVYGRSDIGLSKTARWVNRGFMVNMCQGETYFSFIYVEDFINVLYTALVSPATAGKTYYVCEDKQYQWTYFIGEMAKAMGKKMPTMITLPPGQLMLLGKVYARLAKLLHAEAAFHPDKAREAAAGNWIASPKLWMQDTGWKCWTPLTEGMSKSFTR